MIRSSTVKPVSAIIQKAVVFLGGSSFIATDSLVNKALQQVKSQSYFCVAADHGADLALACNFIPNLIIGDNDSISSFALQEIAQLQIPQQLFPIQKDYTDSELVFRYLHRQHFKEIVVFGLEGNRPDHFLANIFLLRQFAAQGMKIKIVGQEAVYYLFTEYLEINSRVGDLLSLLALTSSVKSISSRGLKYKLNERHLSFGTSLGVSNIFTKTKAKLSFKKGVLLAIHVPK